jgi:hypothetical protein
MWRRVELGKVWARMLILRFLIWLLVWAENSKGGECRERAACCTLRSAQCFIRYRQILRQSVGKGERQPCCNRTSLKYKRSWFIQGVENESKGTGFGCKSQFLQQFASEDLDLSRYSCKFTQQNPRLDRGCEWVFSLSRLDWPRTFPLAKRSSDLLKSPANQSHDCTQSQNTESSVESLNFSKNRIDVPAFSRHAMINPHRIWHEGQAG